MKTILRAKNVQKVYGSKGNQYKALENIDLDIKEGEFIGIMGPSGAGKSTLLNILSTIDTLTSGDITIDNQNIVTMKEEQLSDFRRNHLGFIFQDYNLLDTLTVRENILLPLALSKVPAKEIEKRVKEITNTFGIQGILDKYPYHISGGQKLQNSRQAFFQKILDVLATLGGGH
ncbi:ATP-binding cassette domain-containing protein [Ureibacillus sp. Re31]|uniref:ATP-binding cassette domain-containing protein n=1 Tax=Ureibacillus galli TaxID=2762222 RepID=A0ABR8XB33_9BACL|nr:ATP-binding cassette domain-containing protein [Ureibacillus galli]MBD8026322.1 ATP-binding cassette domain-containing protein [Ureibacillus galli]